MDALNKPAESRPRVLIVDDEAAICLLLNELLNDAGYHCQTTSSGEQALEILRQQEFDVLISDLRLPGMSGLALLDAVRAEYPKMILLLAAGGDDLQTRTEATKHGAHDYLVKPFRLDAVVATLRRALENKAT
jgi:two-component system response regulator AtoC